ncbi:MAG: hypothetical protein WCH75_01205 [Candidatus Binatia bacterium]|jgi:hypothetical protein
MGDILAIHAKDVKWSHERTIVERAGKRILTFDSAISVEGLSAG